MSLTIGVSNDERKQIRKLIRIGTEQSAKKLLDYSLSLPPGCLVRDFAHKMLIKLIDKLMKYPERRYLGITILWDVSYLTACLPKDDEAFNQMLDERLKKLTTEEEMWIQERDLQFRRDWMSDKTT